MTFIQVLNLVALPIFVGLVLCIYGYPGIKLSALLLTVGAALAVYISSVAVSQGYHVSDALLFTAAERFYTVNGSLAYAMMAFGIAGIGKRKFGRQDNPARYKHDKLETRAEYE